MREGDRQRIEPATGANLPAEWPLPDWRPATVPAPSELMATPRLPPRQNETAVTAVDNDVRGSVKMITHHHTACSVVCSACGGKGQTRVERFPESSSRTRKTHKNEKCMKDESWRGYVRERTHPAKQRKRTT